MRSPKIAQNLGGRAQANPAGAILKALVSKMTPRWLKMSPNSSDLQKLSWKALDPKNK